MSVVLLFILCVFALNWVITPQLATTHFIALCALCLSIFVGGLIHD